MSSKKRKPLQAAQAPPRKRPDTSEIAVAQVMDKYSEYPSNGLTPERLANIFKEADAGDVMRQMELFEEMEEKDPHLFSQLQTRKNAVTGLDYEIIPFDSDDEQDKVIAEFVQEQISSLENFEEIETDLLDAIGKGIAVSEIIWGYDDGHVVVSDVRSRHQKRFYWDSIDDSFKVRTVEHPEGITLPQNKFLVHKYKARSGHPSRAGILRVVAWMYLFKNYTIKDWVSFAEVFGLPLRLGKYQPGASEADKAALMTVPVDDTEEQEYSYYFQRPSVPSYDRYIKTASQGITKASKAFMLDAVVEEDRDRLIADMEENPGIAITIGNRLTEILGLTNTVNLKKL